MITINHFNASALYLEDDPLRLKKQLSGEMKRLKNFKIVPGELNTKDTIERIKNRFFQYSRLIHSVEALLILEDKPEEEMFATKRKLLERIATIHEKEAVKYRKKSLKPFCLKEGSPFLFDIEDERVDSVVGFYYDCARECRESIESLEEQKKRNR